MGHSGPALADIFAQPVVPVPQLASICKNPTSRSRIELLSSATAPATPAIGPIIPADDIGRLSAISMGHSGPALADIFAQPVVPVPQLASICKNPTSRSRIELLSSATAPATPAIGPIIPADDIGRLSAISMGHSGPALADIVAQPVAPAPQLASICKTPTSRSRIELLSSATAPATPAIAPIIPADDIGRLSAISMGHSGPAVADIFAPPAVPARNWLQL